MDAGLKAGTSTTAAGSNDAAGGEGEGEGGGLSNDERATLGSTASGTSQPAPAANAVTHTSAQSQPLSPTLALQQLLGSSRQSAGQGGSSLSAPGVDAAMQSLLPALELKLADDLEDSLASDGDRSTAATDEIVGQL